MGLCYVPWPVSFSKKYKVRIVYDTVVDTRRKIRRTERTISDISEAREAVPGQLGAAWLQAT